MLPGSDNYHLHKSVRLHVLVMNLNASFARRQWKINVGKLD